MILSLTLMMVAVILEVAVAPIGFFVLSCWWIYVTRGINEAVVAATVGGIVLDVLSPRHLGTSGLIVLMFLLALEILIGQGRKDSVLAIIGVGCVILEGIIVGRSALMIVCGLILIVIVVVAKEVRGSREGGIIVRRQI